MAFVIPNYRFTAGPLTAPAGKHYIVKSYNVSTASIGGTTYYNNLHSSGAVGLVAVDGSSYGRLPILRPTDTATSASGNLIYWSLEDDFNFVSTIPAYRTTSVTRSTAGTSTITVPAGQTWIIQLIDAQLTADNNIVPGGTTTHDIDINPTGGTLKLLQWGQSGVNPLVSLNTRLNTGKFILKAGDTITHQLSLSGPALGSGTVRVLYWILEQDF
jgi:hypothetical protein